MQTHTPLKAPACVIRKGQPTDAQPIAALGRHVFYETFKDITKPTDMQSYLDEHYHPERLQTELIDPSLVFFVAQMKDAIVGFAQTRRGPTDPSVHGPSPLELQRLYVNPTWHGKGIAPLLIREVGIMAAEQGYETLWLGVEQNNHRAQRFYQNFGLKVSGKHIFYVGSDPQTDLIMEGSTACWPR